MAVNTPDINGLRDPENGSSRPESGPPTPQQDIAEAFWQLFSPDDPTARLRFVHEAPRPVDPATGNAEKKPPSAEREGTLAELWPTVVDFQRRGYAVYYFLNRVRSGRGSGYGGTATDQDVEAIRVLATDHDDRGLPDEWHHPPGIVVYTSTVEKDGQLIQKAQALWLVPGLPIGEFEEVLQRFAAYYGSDPSVKNASRIFRLPGSLHQKGEPQLVTFEDHTDGMGRAVAPCAKDVLEGLPAAVKRPQRDPVPAPERVVFDAPGIDEWAVALIAATMRKDGEPIIGTNLNDRTVALANRLGDGPAYGYSVPVERAVALVCEHWSREDRIEDAVRSAYRSRENALGCGQVGSTSRSLGPTLAPGSFRFDLDTAIAALGDPFSDVSPEDRYGDPALYAQAKADRADDDALVSAAGRRPRNVEWLWKGWLARGKLHILAGDKGVGKSTLAYDLLATITRGGKWPDGTQSAPGNVVIWSAEDDFDDTILPRFLAAGGDPDRLFPVEKVRDDRGVERQFDPAYDMPILLRKVRKTKDVSAVLIDPIVSAVSGDSHKNAETRRGLQPLVDLAEECRAALIGITHFTKGTDGKNPVERVTGSLAFAALARIVLCASADEEGEQRRLVRASSNIGQNGGGFGYTLQPAPVPDYDIRAQHVIWGSSLTGSARELLGDCAKQDQLTKAIEFIHKMLADGPVLSKDMREAASAHGHSWPTVERARAKMPQVVVEQFSKSRNVEAAPGSPLPLTSDFRHGWYWRKTTAGECAVLGKVEY